MFSQFGNAEYQGIRVVPAKVTEFRDKVIEPRILNLESVVGNDDNVLSDVRKLAATNSTAGVLRTCFIDKNIVHIKWIV